MGEMTVLLSAVLYFIALVNPISKVFILSVMAREIGPRELRLLALRSSGVALAILLVFSLLGHVVLTMLFHVELYAFQIVGGIVLFFTGFRALSRGLFYDQDEHKSVAEMAIVPLASPMIAGPASITAAISFPSLYGKGIAIAAMVAALAVNLAFMLFAQPMGRVLERYNLMGALIRITGMIVATIAVQMVLTGLATWYPTLHAVAAAAPGK